MESGIQDIYRIFTYPYVYFVFGVYLVTDTDAIYDTRLRPHPLINYILQHNTTYLPMLNSARYVNEVRAIAISKDS